jgi:hypothetical protein
LLLDPKLLAVSVGSFSAAPPLVTVGNNEHAGALVESANRACEQRDRKRRIAEPSQLAHGGVNPVAGAAPTVLSDHPARTEFSNDSSTLEEEAASRTAKALSRARWAEVLAWEPEANEVDGGEVSFSNEGDIFILNGPGPMLAEHPPAEGIPLDLPDRLTQAGALEPKLQTADPRAERSDSHGFAM